MPAINPNASKEIDRAFAKFTGFQRDYCNYLRVLVNKALPGVKEDWKWGPNFNLDGMVCGIWGFKNHVKLNFFKGSLMSDKYGLFTDAENDKGNRSIDFTEHDKIDDEKVIEYLQEAAALNKQGIRVEKKPVVADIPPELQKILETHKGLKMYFEKLAPSYRREYAEYIADAKQPETRERRIKKVMEMLKDNKKINEKYNNRKKYTK